MKIASVLLLAAAGSAAAFVPHAVLTRSVKLSLSEEAEEAEAAPAPAAPAPVASTRCISKAEILSSPNTIEFQQVWDPLNLADLGSDETLAWFRHSEIKHGRIAMAAFVGWCAVGAGLRWPGELAYGLDYSSIPSKGLEAWDAVPGYGKAQILLFIGFLEWGDEYFFSQKGEHYLRGGTPGKNMVPGLFDPAGLSKNRSEEAKARGRDVEIKNGRLAMIGVMGMIAQALVPGSVPFQPDC